MEKQAFYCVSPFLYAGGRTNFKYYGKDYEQYLTDLDTADESIGNFAAGIVTNRVL